MSDIQRGVTFTTGIPDAPTAHNLVDQATILPAFITGKASAPPGANDSFVFVASSSGGYRKCSLTQLIGAFPQGGAGSVFALRKLGTDATSAAAGNDSRFPATLTGVRRANNTSPDTVAAPKDLSFASVSLTATTQVDWDASDIFTDQLSGDKIYTFANVRDGRSIKLIIKINGHQITFPAGTQVTYVGAGGTYCYIQLSASPFSLAVGVGVFVN